MSPVAFPDPSGRQPGPSEPASRLRYRLDHPSRECGAHATLSVADRAGNSYCYNCIIETFQGPAYNLACRILNDRFLGEDAVQESLVAGYRSFHQFRGDNLPAWLMRIVANTCRDMLRSRRSRPALPLDPTSSASNENDGTFPATDRPSRDEGPEEYAERRELRRAIETCLSGLPEERRWAILLVDVQGFNYAEAAFILQCSPGTVKSRISRGRRQLRDCLRAAGELLPSRFRQKG